MQHFHQWQWWNGYHYILQIGQIGNNKFCSYNPPNRNGEYQTNFSLENRLTCLNTKFQKWERKLWTYTSPNNTKVQWDYILINKNWINSALNCEAYSSFEYPLITESSFLCRNKKQTVEGSWYKWSLLTNSDISNQYTITVRNEFDTL